MRGTVIGLLTAAVLQLSWPGAASAATGWVLQPVPLPPGAMYGMTTAVSCPTATNCTAVGFSNKLVHGTRDLLTEQWTDGAWTVRPAAKPTAFAGGDLAGVSCVSPTRCTAVGGYANGNTGIAQPLAETWNGSAWALQPIPNPPGTMGSFLQGISCTSAGACTAVGSTGANQAPLAERWNGTAWAIQPTPAPTGLAILNGVSCTGPARCMAVGIAATSALAESWNGSNWTVQPVPVPAGGSGANLASVSCTATDDCHAVGYYVTGTGQDQPLAEAWNGTAWAVQHAPPHLGGGELNGVSCTSAAACTAVGGGAGLAEVWNGSRWAVQRTASPAGHNLFESVSCVAASNCTAVGDGSPSTSGHKALPLAEHE